MSTRSYIGIENKDGTVTAVYCHFDGYLSGVGQTLLNHYKKRTKVQALIDLGNLSYIGKTPKKSRAYHSWRGDPLEQMNKNLKWSFAEEFKNDIHIEYVYLFSKGKWYHLRFDNGNPVYRQMDDKYCQSEE